MPETSLLRQAFKASCATSILPEPWASCPCSRPGRSYWWMIRMSSLHFGPLSGRRKFRQEPHGYAQTAARRSNLNSPLVGAAVPLHRMCHSRMGVGQKPTGIRAMSESRFSARPWLACPAQVTNLSGFRVTITRSRPDLRRDDASGVI